MMNQWNYYHLNVIKSLFYKLPISTNLTLMEVKIPELIKYNNCLEPVTISLEKFQLNEILIEGGEKNCIN